MFTTWFVENLSSVIVWGISRDNAIQTSLFDTVDREKQAALAKGEIIKAFRKNDAYEEFLFDVFSYCEEGMLLEQFPTTSEFSFDDMLEHLFSDMQGTLD